MNGSLLLAVKILLVFVLILMIAVIICAFVIKSLKQSKCLLEGMNAALEYERDFYFKQIKKLTTAEKITSDNRRESDEKIESLHSGDAVDNALAGLSNGKS